MEKIIFVVFLIAALNPANFGITNTIFNKAGAEEESVAKEEAALGEPDPSSFSAWITAYSSTPEETDETPYTTASGKTVQDGFAASNSLPFGTRIKIPELFGDKIFVVEDRMHERKNGFIDIWMSSKQQAINFGINRAEVFVLD